jgi:hypothetical protein
MIYEYCDFNNFSFKQKQRYLTLRENVFISTFPPNLLYNATEEAIDFAIQKSIRERNSANVSNASLPISERERNPPAINYNRDQRVIPEVVKAKEANRPPLPSLKQLLETDKQN